MSIPVDLGDLPDRLDERGHGYLLTTAGEQVKVVACLPLHAEGVIRVTDPGRGSVANVRANEVVTLLWSPLVDASDGSPGHSLVVDGTAVVDGDDVLVTATGAVLHRPHGSDEGPEVPGGCG